MKASRITLVVVALLLGSLAVGGQADARIESPPVPGRAAPDRAPQAHALQGRVTSGGSALSGYKVTLYANFLVGGPRWAPLGSATSDALGQFRITYRETRGGNKTPALFLVATRGPASLASALPSEAWGQDAQVAVNERTTVATGTAFARFVRGLRIDGNRYGMGDGALMAANLADPSTGDTG